MSRLPSPVQNLASRSLLSVAFISEESLPWGSGAFAAQDHFTEVEVEDLCENETTTAALIDVLGRFGLREHLSRQVSDQEDRVVFSLGGDELGHCRMLGVEAYVYANTPKQRPRILNTMVSRATHAGTFNGYLSRLVFVAEDRLDDLGSLAVSVEKERTQEFNAVVALWWRLRQIDGVAPEAARLVLNLTVASSTLRRLSFPADGSAPTLLPVT